MNPAFECDSSPAVPSGEGTVDSGSVVPECGERPFGESLILAILASATSRRGWMRAALIGVGGMGLGVFCLADRHVKEKWEQIRVQEELAATKRRAAEERVRMRERQFRVKLSREAQKEMVLAQAADAELAANQIEALKTELGKLYGEAVSCTPAIAADLGSFAGVVRSIGLLTKDKVTGSSDMNAMLEQSLSPLTQIMAQMTAAADQALAQVGRGVDGNSNAMGSRLLVFIEQARNEDHGAIALLAASLAPAIEAIQAGGIRLAAGVGSVPLDVGCIWVVLRDWLWGRLGKWVERAAATGTANVALVAVDGPLPVGDMIVLLLDVGFAIWTTWDVWHLSKTIPSEIDSQLHGALRAHQEALMAAVQEEVTRLRERAIVARLAAMQPVLALEQP